MLERASWGSCGCPIPGNAQGRVGWGPGLTDLVPDLVISNPVQGREVGTK